MVVRQCGRALIAPCLYAELIMKRDEKVTT